MKVAEKLASICSDFVTSLPEALTVKSSDVELVSRNRWTLLGTSKASFLGTPMDWVLRSGLIRTARLESWGMILASKSAAIKGLAEAPGQLLDYFFHRH